MSAIPKDEISKLSVDERLRILDDIWESLQSDPDALPLSDAQRVELDIRLAAHEADPDAAVDFDTVLSRLRDRK
jgi:putative addiction module component (TIGR02574 family)